jgi:integrase
VAIGPRAQALVLDLIPIRCPCCGVEDRPSRLASPDGCICGTCAGEKDRRRIAGPWQRVEAVPDDACLIDPRRVVEERRIDRRRRRRTRVQPSQRDRRKPRPQWKPGEVFERQQFARAIRRACERAGIPSWHPHQLRHAHATEVRKAFGLEAVQASLGHAHAKISEIYAQRDSSLAAKIAEAVG